MSSRKVKLPVNAPARMVERVLAELQRPRPGKVSARQWDRFRQCSKQSAALWLKVNELFRELAAGRRSR